MLYLGQTTGGNRKFVVTLASEEILLDQHYLLDTSNKQLKKATATTPVESLAINVSKNTSKPFAIGEKIHLITPSTDYEFISTLEAMTVNLNDVGDGFVCNSTADGLVPKGGNLAQFVLTETNPANTVSTVTDKATFRFNV